MLSAAWQVIQTSSYNIYTFKTAGAAVPCSRSTRKRTSTFEWVTDWFLRLVSLFSSFVLHRRRHLWRFREKKIIDAQLNRENAFMYTYSNTVNYFSDFYWNVLFILLPFMLLWGTEREWLAWNSANSYPEFCLRTDTHNWCEVTKMYAAM
jgi:hypothetical protein